MENTTKKYWVFLEALRQSGVTNMYGAAPFIVFEFGVTKREARKILADWMKNYNHDDYKEDASLIRARANALRGMYTE